MSIDYLFQIDDVMLERHSNGDIHYCLPDKQTFIIMQGQSFLYYHLEPNNSVIVNGVKFLRQDLTIENTVNIKGVNFSKMCSTVNGIKTNSKPVSEILDNFFD